MAGQLYMSAVSAGREKKSSDVQYFFKRFMARNVSVNSTTGAMTVAWVISGDKDVIRIDSKSKQPPEATDPTTYDIASDDVDRVYAETVTGRPTLGTGTSEIVFDGSFLDILNAWKRIPKIGETITGVTGLTNTAEDIILSCCMVSQTGMIRVYPRIELLAATAGNASSENTDMTATLNFQRRDRQLYDDAYAVYPPAMVAAASANSTIKNTTAPAWSLDFGKTYADIKALYTEIDGT